MKNFSGIADNLDITTKKYVDDGLAGKANLAGNNTFTGGQTITGANAGYSIDASGYVKGSWLQSSVMQNKGSNTGKVCVFDNSGWIYYRTPTEILTEAGGVSSTEVVQATGTSMTSVMSQKATTDELVKKANLNGGNTFTGKQLFNNTVGGVTNQLVLNETQWDIFTCRDLTSPTTKTAIGKGFVWCQDSDAIYSQFKATGIYYGNDNNGTDCNLLFPKIPSGESLEKTIATTDQIPDVSGKANLNGGNDFTGGGQDFILPNGNTFYVSDENDITLVSINKEGFEIDDEGTGTIPMLLHNDAGTSGQVLTSQGAGKTPVWKELVTLDTDQDITGHKTFTTPQSGGPKIGIYNGQLSVRSSSASGGSVFWNTPSDNIAADFSVDGNGAHLNLGVDAAADIRLNGNAGIAGQVLTSRGENMTPIWQDVTKHGYTELTNEDLNTILTPGWYRAARNHSCKNIPIASPNEFILIVESSSPNYIQQTFYNIGILSQYYIRYTNNGGTSWSGAGWYTYQLVGTAVQTFSGRKTFSNGINLTNSLQVGGLSGTTGQFLMSQGGSTPKWSSIQVKVNGTVYTIDGNGLIDLGTIGGTTTHTSMGNDIY